MPTACHVDGRQSKATFDASVVAAAAAAEQEIDLNDRCFCAPEQQNTHATQ
jgi:hypothetical protein